MQKNNFYISFGIWIAVLPWLGLPGGWRDALVSLSGLFLVLVALGPTILQKLQKPKPKRGRKPNPVRNSGNQDVDNWKSNLKLVDQNIENI